MTNLQAANAAAATEDESDFSLRKMRVAFAVLVGTLFGSSILPFMALSLLLLPMTQEFHWSRTAFSGGQTALMLAGACAAPILGNLVDRFGVRLMIIGGTVVVGFVVMAMSLQDGSLWQFYAMWAVLGVTGTTAIGYSKVIGALFNKHRGKALAIFGIESSIAGAFAPLLAQYLINEFGWRGMFVGLGLIILAVVPVLLLWLDEPGAQPTKQAQIPASALPGLEMREVLRTRAFWLIVIATLLAAGPGSGLMPHFFPYLVSRGFDASSAAAAISAMTIGMAVGTVVGGWAVDWAKGAWIAAPFSAISALALASFMVISAQFGGVAALAGVVAAMGFAMGAHRPMGTYFQLGFFGLKTFGTIVGVQSPFLAIAMGVAPLLVGWCYDAYGTYQPAFIVIALCAGATVLIYLMLGPYRFAAKPTPALAQPAQPGDEKAVRPA